MPTGGATLTSVGSPADPTKNFSIALSKGWNQVGDAFPATVTFQSTQFIAGNTTEAWGQAVQNGALDGFVYAYNPSSNKYDTVSSLIPGSGYWVYAFSAGNLIMPHP